MSNNLNTTIDKVAMSEFDMHYYQLGDNEKQGCHDEMVNNKEWLEPEWKKPLWSVSCLLYTSPSPRDRQKSRMPSSA